MKHLDLLLAMTAAAIITSASVAQRPPLIVRYSSEGGNGSTDTPSVVTSDSSGNIIVSGTGPEHRALTVKYSSDGNLLWAADLRRPGSHEIRRVAVDALGNIFIGGWIHEESSNNYDYLMVKYDANGERQWIQTFNGSGNGDDFLSDMAVSPDGGVVVTGSSWGGVSNYDWVTIKYRADGSRDWNEIWAGEGQAEDHANGLTVDSAGSAYVTGTVSRSWVVTIKYGARGESSWVSALNASIGSYGLDVVTDASGHAYVSGAYFGDGIHYEDYMLIKYDSSGNQVWRSVFEKYGTSDRPIAMQFDGAGTIFVTGDSNERPLTAAWAIESGFLRGNDELFEQGYSAQAAGLALGVDGSVFVACSTQTQNIATAKYEPESWNPTWIAEYDGPASGYDRAAGITLDPFGNLIVCGLSHGVESGADYAIIKYYVSEGDCIGTERLKVDCYIRCRDRGVLIGARAVTSLPENTPVTFTLDGERPVSARIKRSGRAKAKWRNVEEGQHAIELLECQHVETSDCCR